MSKLPLTQAQAAIQIFSEVFTQESDKVIPEMFPKILPEISKSEESEEPQLDNHEMNSNSLFVETSEFIVDQICLVCDIECESASEANEHVKNFHSNLILEQNNYKANLSGKTETCTNQNTIVELRRKDVENSQKTLFKNKTRNSNEEITDCGLFIQENCETLPDKEESKVLSEIKFVHCQQDSPEKSD